MGGQRAWSRGEPSRRTVLAAALGISVAALVLPAATPASAATSEAPTTPEAAAALARSLIGLTLADLQAQAMTEAPYGTFHGEWCAVLASWLVRGTGVPFMASSAELYAALAPITAAPAVGDIVYYPDPGHLGFVVDIVDGLPVTVEGNGPDGRPWDATTVNLIQRPWHEGYLFARPAWPVPPPPPAPHPVTEDDMVRIITYQSTGPRGGNYLVAPGYWHAFTGEEWVQASRLGLFANVPVITPANDHEFDLLRSTFLVSERNALSMLSNPG